MKKPVVLSTIIIALTLTLAVYLLLRPRQSPQNIISHAKSLLLSSPGWKFEESINCSDTYALIRGNVSLNTHEISSSILLIPKFGTPQVYILFANATDSFINYEGGWIRSGGGWKEEDILLFRLLETAGNTTEVYDQVIGEKLKIVFNSTCQDSCLKAFEAISAITGTSIPRPSHVFGEITFSPSGKPQTVLAVFKSQNGRCILKYDLSYNDTLYILKP